jgi:adenine/guanine phosphoribosyltransferase-like PRPP-binding protein
LGYGFGIVGVAAYTSAAVAVYFVGLTTLGAKLTRTRWQLVLQTHAGGLLLAAAIAAALLATVPFVRSLGYGPLATLTAGLAVAVGAATIAIALLHRPILGSDGAWWSKTLRHSLSKRLNTKL